MKSKYHFKSGQYKDEARVLAIQREAKVIKFLIANPLSSSEEITKATGCGTGNVRAGLLKYVQYAGKRCYRINQTEYRKLFT